MVVEPFTSSRSYPLVQSTISTRFLGKHFVFRHVIFARALFAQCAQQDLCIGFSLVFFLCLPVVQLRPSRGKYLTRACPQKYIFEFKKSSSFRSKARTRLVIATANSRKEMHHTPANSRALYLIPTLLCFAFVSLVKPTEGLFLFSVLPTLKDLAGSQHFFAAEKAKSDMDMKRLGLYLPATTTLRTNAGSYKRTLFPTLRMQGGSDRVEVYFPTAVPQMPKQKASLPLVIPQGVGIRRDSSGRIWAGDFLLLDKFDTKTIGLDISDGRGVFLRSYAKTDTSFKSFSLGHLSCSSLLAGARQKLWWMVPSWGRSADDIPDETQFLLMRMSKPLVDERERDEGDGAETFALILSMVSGPYRSSLRKGKGGSNELVLNVESGDKDVAINQPVDVAFVCTGTDPYKMLESAFAAVADRVKTFKVRSQKQFPPTLDYFGWCTWDAFYCQVSGPKIETGLESLKAGGVPAKFLIIDDGWQDVDNDDQVKDKPSANSQVSLADPSSDKPSKAWCGVTDAIALPLGKVVEWASGQLEKYYQTKVERAPLGSVHISIWATLAQTILKAPLLDTYKKRFEYTKRLMSPRANNKFASSMSGPAGEGFKGFVQKIKKEQGLQYVYCWHALLGYWSGVGGEFNADWGTVSSSDSTVGLGAAPVRVVPSTGILGVEPQLSWDPLLLNSIGMSGMTSHGVIGGSPGGPDGMKAGASALAQSIHKYLSDCGIDGVKVDAQAATVMMGQGLGGSAHVAREYIHAMEESVARNFGPDNHCINCMCHPSECIYSYKTTSVARVSDDFYPRDASSHTVHIANVAYNSIFLGEVIQPDWDMFQSNHPAALLHAAARAVSGGAVYVSDHPNDHDFTLLKRLVMSDGRTLRAKLPGRPTRDTLFADVTSDHFSALKVFNHNSYGGVVGAFNVQGAAWCRITRAFSKNAPTPPDVTTIVRPMDVSGLTEEDKDGVYGMYGTHYSADGKVVQRFARVGSCKEGVQVQLKSKEAAMFTVVRVEQRLTAAGGAVYCAPVGLADMLNGGAAVLSHEVLGGDAAKQLPLRGVASVVGEGRFVVLSSQSPQSCFVDGAPVAFTYTPASESEAGHFTLELPVMTETIKSHDVVYVFEGVELESAGRAKENAEMAASA